MSSVDHAVAVFCSTYPGLFFSPGWPTSDTNVPWALFWVLLRRVANVEALSALTQTRAASLGGAFLFSGDDAGQKSELKRAVTDLADQAQGG